jgi:hypothetical protein
MQAKNEIQAEEDRKMFAAIDALANPVPDGCLVVDEDEILEKKSQRFA